MFRLFSRVFAVCFLVLLCGAGIGLAQSTSTHTVQSGETLFSIAKANGVSIQQIKAWNNLSSSQLSVGQKLVIKKPNAEQSSDADQLTHKVEPHETLYSISNRYHVSIAHLKKWNNLQGSELQVGSKLVIHRGQATPSNPTSSSQAKSSTYIVKSGDSLYRIAHQYNMTISRLKELNDLSSNNLQVGQKLILEPTDQPPSLSAAGVESSSQGRFIRYTVEKTQSREDLLEKFQMDESELKALNPGLRSSTFHRGDNVNLLAPANQSFKNPYQTDASMNSLGSTTAVKYDKGRATPTTSGELYNPEALTAAHAHIALGSVIYDQNDQNKRGVFVRINDRTTNDGLQLSDAAWRALNLSGSTATVTLYRNND